MLQALQEKAKLAPATWARAGLADVTHPVLVVEGLENAFVSGYRHPQIWLGLSQLNSPALASILQHELVHIRQRDNLILLFITLLSDVFWWNPLVRALTRQARRFVELSCDHVCQTSTPEYRENLANELINREYRMIDSGLVNPISRSRSFNVYRLRQLAKETSMKTRHFVCFGLLAIVSFLLVSNVAASNADETEQQILTHLTVKTVTTGDNGEKSTRSIETQFIGEPEVKQLFESAAGASVTVNTRMVNETLRIIEIESVAPDETRKR